MLQRSNRRDEGMTLIEVVVALLVFALISTGILSAMTTITRMTGENLARVAAQNLASREIDRMRALEDPFKVMAATSTADRTGVDYVVDGRTYTIQRSVSWVTRTGADVPCSAGSSLFYIRVNVRVTWAGMLANTAPVQDDTLMAPTSSLTDASTGAIAVYVKDDQGVAQPGVGVTIAANTGGTTPAKQPANTDSAGCSYAGNISPGNYDVTISKSGWIDLNQYTSPSTTSAGGGKGAVQVSKGATTSQTFAGYAQGATITTNYVGAPTTQTSFTLPSGLETSFWNSNGNWPVSSSSQGSAVLRYPYGSGYNIALGLVKRTSDGVECASVDPSNWNAGTMGGVAVSAGVRATTASVAGQASTVQVPVGVVQAKIPAGMYLGATQATPAAGTPSCGITGSVYVYPLYGTGAWQTVALPYGSWKLYVGTSQNNATVLGPSSVQILSNQVNTTVAADGTFTLDPRKKS